MFRLTQSVDVHWVLCSDWGFGIVVDGGGEALGRLLEVEG